MTTATSPTSKKTVCAIVLDATQASAKDLKDSVVIIAKIVSPLRNGSTFPLLYL